MKQVIIGFFALLSAFNLLAEPALYKEIPVNDINRFHLKGNFDITLQQGEKTKLELYLRESRHNEVQVSLEKITKKDTLVIEEQIGANGNPVDQQVIANIVFTVAERFFIKVKDIKQLTASNINNELLFISASGKANINISNSDVEHLDLRLFDQSKLFAEHLISDKIYLYQKHKSYSDIHKSQVALAEFYVKDRSELESVNIRGDVLKVKSVDDAKLTILADSYLKACSLVAEDKSEIDLFGHSEFCDITAKDRAQITVKNAEKLNINAYDRSIVKYSDTAKVYKKRFAKAQITAIPKVVTDE